MHIIYVEKRILSHRMSCWFKLWEKRKNVTPWISLDRKKVAVWWCWRNRKCTFSLPKEPSRFLSSLITLSKSCLDHAAILGLSSGICALLTTRESAYRICKKIRKCKNSENRWRGRCVVERSDCSMGWGSEKNLQQVGGIPSHKISCLNFYGLLWAAQPQIDTNSVSSHF